MDKKNIRPSRREKKEKRSSWKKRNEKKYGSPPAMSQKISGVRIYKPKETPPDVAFPITLAKD